jgi:transcriptional regulator with XRE-family HTH domain
MPTKKDYDNQRLPVPAPLVPLSALRASHGLTQDAVCQAVQAITNKTFTKGALSAIENGHRGASAETLAALEVALRLPAGSLVVGYEPSHTRRKGEVAA